MNSVAQKISESQTLNGFGFYASALLSLITVATFVIAIMTPPLSGPFCPDGCFEYPFTTIADRFPRDYYWMYPAMALLIAYLASWAAIHRFVPEKKKIFSLASLIAASISGAVLLTDYFIQVSVVQPSLLNGETDGISLLSQYNPHGLFIAMEELGYLMMSLSFILIAPVFSGNKLENSLRWILIGSFVIALGSLILTATVYGVHREYRFEVLAITIDWLTLIIAGILLNQWFKRHLKITDPN